MELWGGVECTVNRVGDAYRDQALASGHDARSDDLALFAAAGIRALRFPILWERTRSSSDLEVVDAQLAQLRSLDVRPIAGLIHHGSGPARTDLLAADFAPGLAAHAATVAARYPWVRDWTPVNEPLTTARFSGLYGHWFPHRRDERSCWLALLNQIDGVRLSMRAIRAVNPAARLVQTDDLGEAQGTAPMAAQVEFENHRRWLSWDLLAGLVVPGHALWERISGHGLGDRLRAIADDPCPADVVGINHYLCSNRFLTHEFDRHPTILPASDGEPCINLDAVRTLASAADAGQLLREAAARYGTAVAITECHNGSTRDEQLRWFVQTWEAARTAAAAGVPVEAVTAWSLLGAFDWNSLLTRDDRHYECGVFDLRSTPPRPTALAKLLPALAAGTAAGPVFDIARSPGWWQSRGRFYPDHGLDAPDAPAPVGAPILITGATGTLAQALAAACRTRGLPYVVTAREELALTEPKTIAAALERHRPWAVINCAGMVDIEAAERSRALCHRVNALGAEAVAVACAARGVKLVQISSDQVFDGGKGEAYVESDGVAAVNAYGRAKAEAERRVLRVDRAALVVRTSAFFSPFDRHNFAVHVVDSLAGGGGFAAARDELVSPTYVPDLVQAVLDLLIDGERGVWHLANGGGMSWAEFARALATASDLDPSGVRAVSGKLWQGRAPRPGDVRLTSERGIILPTLASAIGRFAAAYRPVQDAMSIAAE